MENIEIFVISSNRGMARNKKCEHFRMDVLFFALSKCFGLCWAGQVVSPTLSFLFHFLYSPPLHCLDLSLSLSSHSPVFVRFSSLRSREKNVYFRRVMSLWNMNQVIEYIYNKTGNRIVMGNSKQQTIHVHWIANRRLYSLKWYSSINNVLIRNLCLIFILDSIKSVLI